MALMEEAIIAVSSHYDLIKYKCAVHIIHFMHVYICAIQLWVETISLKKWLKNLRKKYSSYILYTLFLSLFFLGIFLNILNIWIIFLNRKITEVNNRLISLSLSLSFRVRSGISLHFYVVGIYVLYMFGRAQSSRK